MADRIFHDWTDDTSLKTAIGQALGAASVCWSNPAGAGVFDAERCTQIAKELEEFVNLPLNAPERPEEVPPIWVTSTED